MGETACAASPSPVMPMQASLPECGATGQLAVYLRMEHAGRSQGFLLMLLSSV